MTFTGRVNLSPKAQQHRAQESLMSSASSQRPQQREVTVMCEPNRLEPLVLQAAYRWVAPPIRKPLRLRQCSVPRPDETGALHDARERSAQ